MPTLERLKKLRDDAFREKRRLDTDVISSHERNRWALLAAGRASTKLINAELEYDKALEESKK